MNAQIKLGKTTITIRGADHLHVAGELIEIRRVTPAGNETLAVAGDGLRLGSGPDARAKVDQSWKAMIDGASWQPVQPLD